MVKLMGLFAVVATLLATPAAQSETLADALIAAYKTSNLLDQNQAVLRAADEDAAIAVANMTEPPSALKYGSNSFIEISHW